MKLSLAPSVVLSELLSFAPIELSLYSRERDVAFAELIGKIPDLIEKPHAREALLKALQVREKLCSTEMGGGVAIPHTRNSITGLEHPFIVFGRQLDGLPTALGMRSEEHTSELQSLRHLVC